MLLLVVDPVDQLDQCLQRLALLDVLAGKLRERLRATLELPTKRNQHVACELRRGLHTKDGEHRVPLELVHERLKRR